MSAAAVAVACCVECGRALSRLDAQHCREHRYLALRRTGKMYTATDAIDQLIRAANEQYLANDRQAIKRCAARIGWPRHQVNRRRGELGMVRAKESRWSEPEEQLLARWGHLTPEVIARKFREAGIARSVNAIKIRMTRLRIKANLEGYSARSLADAFGVDNHKVTGWLNRGWLIGDRRGTARGSGQNGDTWWIRRDDVKRFVLTYPHEVDLRKVEKWWFLDLLTDGKICH